MHIYLSLVPQSKGLGRAFASNSLLPCLPLLLLLLLLLQLEVQLLLGLGSAPPQDSHPLYGLAWEKSVPQLLN